MSGDWALWLVLGVAAMSIPFEVWLVARLRSRAALAPQASPLQTLERRLAAGEISAEEFQYERYLLEKGS